jgi:TusA-related sulfurtransferase
MRTKVETSKLQPGQRLLIIATDPSFQIDCVVFTKQHGHKLVQSWQDGDKYYYILESA